MYYTVNTKFIQYQVYYKNTREQFFRGECYIRTHVNNSLGVNVM